MRKRIIRYSILIIVIVLIASFFVILKNSKTKPNKELTTIRVNEVTRSVFYAPQYVAISNGFFKEYGINVELSTGQGADAVMTAVLSNQCEVGFAGPEASIYVYNEGKEDYTQVFAQLTKKDGSFFISRNKDTNFKWTDVKGKTIIPGRKGGVPYMTLRYVLKKNGIDPEKDVVLDDSIKFDLMAGAFTSGNADYVTLFEPTASMTEEQNKGYIVASVGEEAGEIPYTAYFAKKSFIKNNENLIQNFTKAIYKGEQWVKNHTNREIAEVIQDYFPDTDLDLLEKVIKNYKQIDAWKDTPILKKEDFERLEEVMIDSGELDKKVEYEKVVNNKYAEKCIK